MTEPFTREQFYQEITRIGPNFFNPFDQYILNELKKIAHNKNNETEQLWRELIPNIEKHFNTKNKQIWENKYHPAEFTPNPGTEQNYKMGQFGQFEHIKKQK